MPWDEVIREFVEPIADSALKPNAQNHALYRDLIEKYASYEADALGRAPSPPE